MSIGRSANFTAAVESSLRERVEQFVNGEKIVFTEAERFKLARALAVFNKVSSRAPFTRAMNMLELYENARKGHTLQEEINYLQKSYELALRERDELAKTCAGLRCEIAKYNCKTFWQRVKGVFNA